MEFKTRKVRILLIEDNPGDARLIKEALSETEKIQIEIVHVTRLADVKKVIKEYTIDVIVLDISLPDVSGLETVSKTKEIAPDTAIIVLTGVVDEELAYRAVQEGAQDYLVKGLVDAHVLERVIIYAIERNQSRKRISSLSKQLMRALTEIEYELEISAQIQQKITQEKFPENWEHNIGLYSAFAFRIGGDIYDIKSLPDGKTMFLIADGSGHSLHAALLSVTFKLSLQHQLPNAVGPEDLFNRINNELQPLFLDNMFFTAFTAWFDPQKEELAFTCAGHPAQYLLSPKTKTIQKLKNDCIPLCIYKDTNYTQETIKISRDDKLVMFTDGIYEIFDEERNKFGEEGLERILIANMDLPAKELKNKIVEEIKTFNIESQKDDSILIVIDLKF